jgi:hypothetical protein
MSGFAAAFAFGELLNNLGFEESLRDMAQSSHGAVDVVIGEQGSVAQTAIPRTGGPNSSHIGHLKSITQIPKRVKILAGLSTTTNECRRLFDQGKAGTLLQYQACLKVQ